MLSAPSFLDLWKQWANRKHTSRKSFLIYQIRYLQGGCMRFQDSVKQSDAGVQEENARMSIYMFLTFTLLIFLSVFYNIHNVVYMSIMFLLLVEVL